MPRDKISLLPITYWGNGKAYELAKTGTSSKSLVKSFIP